MSDEIRILTVELENFRQYYGKHKIEFSSRDEGFTIIAGKNGEGKSNLLNAISWCLFHEEPHGMRNSQGGESENKSLSVINNRYIIELDDGNRANTSVKIQLMMGDDTYSISRVLTIIKHRLEFDKLASGNESLKMTQHASDKIPAGCEIFNMRNNFAIKKKGKNDSDFHDTEKEIDPHTLMEEILPKGLSKYFLLDGEFLEGFWKDPSNIREGIEQISQMYLLGTLIKNIDYVRIPPKGSGKATDELTTKINNLLWYDKSLDSDGNEKFSEELRWGKSYADDGAYYHATGNPRIKDLENDIKSMEGRVSEITAALPNRSPSALKSLTERKEKVEKQIRGEKENLNKLRRAYCYNLITKSPYVLLKDAIESSVGVVEERMSLGDLPVRQKKQFAEDLLKRGTCICGEKLHKADLEADPRRKNIEKFRDSLAGKGELDAAVDMRYDLKHDFIDNYDKFLKTQFGEPREKFTLAGKNYNRLEVDLNGINTLLKGSGDIKELIEEQEYLRGQIQDKNDKISHIKSELAVNSKTLSDLNIQLNKSLKKNRQTDKLSHEYDIWNSMHEHLQNIYDELNDDIRINVQKNTWNNFQSMLANPTEFKSFEIERDYSIHLLDQHNVNKIRNLSAGQSLILTLAFVTALREPTGYKFPLIVDSPLGKIDSANSHNIGKQLPEYMPEEQLTLLVTDKEYTAYLPPDPDYPDLPNTPFGKLLLDRIPLKHWKITKAKSGENTGNSNIKPAELVEGNQGWAVEIV